MQSKKHTDQLIKGKEGYVIVISLVITTAVLILLGAFWASTVTEKRNVEISHRSNQALNLAEAGVEKAIWQLNNNPTPPVSGQRKISIDGVGYCEYTITTSEDTVVVQATGYSPEIKIATQVQRSIEVTLLRETGDTTVFDMAFFAGSATGNAIEKTGSGNIDSYDSRNGPYGVNGNKGSNGHLGTNSKSTFPEAVKITESGDIYGNIYIGEGGNPDEAILQSGSGTISGDKTTLDNIGGNRELPEVKPPSLPPLVNKEAWTKTGSGDVPFPGSGRYPSVNISDSGDVTFGADSNFVYVAGDFTKSGSGDLIINANVTFYITGNFDMSGSGNITINNDYKLTMYVGGDIKGTGSGLWNTSMNPSNLTIYGLDSCTQVKISGSTDLYGAVYAKNAEIWLTGSGDVYGSVIGDKIRVTGSSDIHYDEALVDPNNVPNAPTYDYRYTFQSWAEK